MFVGAEEVYGLMVSVSLRSPLRSGRTPSAMRSAIVRPYLTTSCINMQVGVLNPIL